MCSSYGDNVLSNKWPLYCCIIFALMRQAHTWELDQPIPLVLSTVESNLRMPRSFFFLNTIPIMFALLFSCLSSQSPPPTISFIVLSIICYVFANGAIIYRISLSQLLFYVAATAHVIEKKRHSLFGECSYSTHKQKQDLICKWQAWEGNLCFMFLQWFFNFSSDFASVKAVRIIRLNLLLIAAFIAVAMNFFGHPALGLFVLLLSYTLCCHNQASTDIKSMLIIQRLLWMEMCIDGISKIFEV